jgi:hypothetical protein
MNTLKKLGCLAALTITGLFAQVSASDGLRMMTTAGTALKLSAVYVVEKGKPLLTPVQ